MVFLAWVLVWVVVGVQGQEDKKERCRLVTQQHNDCVRDAHSTYIEDLKTGEDGRPHYLAGQSCKYLENAVDICGNMPKGECHSAQKVIKIQNHQLRAILANLKSSRKYSFDSSRCPAVRANKERMKRRRQVVETEEVVEVTEEPEVSSAPT